MINYAHRGASEYAPENTLSSFYLGLLQGANGIETDIQRTKDGVLVLFHDDTFTPTFRFFLGSLGNKKVLSSQQRDERTTYFRGTTQIHRHSGALVSP